MAAKLLELHIHKIGIQGVVNKITLHTENEFNAVCLCGGISLGQCLHNAVVGNGNCLMPPLRSALNQILGLGNCVHFRKSGMQMKLNSFFLSLILLLRLLNGCNSVRAKHKLI